MFLYLFLIFSSLSLYCAEQEIITIEGNICIPYSQPCTTDQLGPYEDACLKLFGWFHEPKDSGESNAKKLTYSKLQDLWIPIHTSSEDSSDWHLCGHPKVNNGSNKIEQSFPRYVPLVLFLYENEPYDLADKISLRLFFQNLTIIAKLTYNQQLYSFQPLFTTPQDMISEILLRHYAFCAHQMQKIGPTTRLREMKMNGRDEEILDLKFGSSSSIEEEYRDVTSFSNRTSR